MNNALELISNKEPINLIGSNSPDIKVMSWDNLNDFITQTYKDLDAVEDIQNIEIENNVSNGFIFETDEPNKRRLNVPEKYSIALGFPQAIIVSHINNNIKFFQRTKTGTFHKGRYWDAFTASELRKTHLKHISMGRILELMQFLISDRVLHSTMNGSIQLYRVNPDYKYPPIPKMKHWQPGQPVSNLI